MSMRNACAHSLALCRCWTCRTAHASCSASLKLPTSLQGNRVCVPLPRHRYGRRRRHCIQALFTGTLACSSVQVCALFEVF